MHDDLWTVTLVGDQPVQPPLKVFSLAANRQVLRFIDTQTLACYELMSVHPATLSAVARLVRIESMV